MDVGAMAVISLEVISCKFPESTNAEETALNAWGLEGLNSFCTLEFSKEPVLLS